MPDKSGARLRATAAEAVDAVVTGGRSLDTVLQTAQQRLPDSDWPMLRLLAFGAIRNHWRLSAQLGRLLDRPLKKKDSVIASLLAIGLFQLTDTRVPQHAAVSMTVDATKMLRRPKFSALVNAVLRNFLRRDLAATEPEGDEEAFNHPRWLIDRLRTDWPEHWREILRANDERAPMWLRVNTARIARDDYVTQLGDAGVAMLPGLEQALRLEKAMPVAALPGYAEGLVSVQDGAAQIAAPWLAWGAAGKRILDACAAPGGKTAHLKELVPDADVCALDIDPKRLQTLRENLARLGLDATVELADASTPQEWWDGRAFDCILLDAPCSATGVIRRHPDIKLTRRESDLAGLRRRQAAILGALWPLLNPGGRLLYVTCSVLTCENEAQVSDFLQQNDDAIQADLLPNNNIRDLMSAVGCGVQILPGREGLDGFYFACLEKTR